MASLRQKRFVTEFLKNGGNAYQAALAAGYAESTARKACLWVNPENQKKPENPGVKFRPDLARMIQEEAQALQDARIADAREVLEYLTAVMRKEATTPVVVRVRGENGEPEYIILDRRPTEAEALRAAAALLKAYKPIAEAQAMAAPVVITGYDDIPD